MSDLPAGLKPANPIHDPVHGRVWLTKLEMDIIDTPEFQRLRSIGQLTPVDLVFPGATHNRFAHSIGAAHVMGMILSQQEFARYFGHRTRKDLIPLLRLAALLHDVGHLPFSHVGEMAWNAFQEDPNLKALNDPDTTVFDLAAAARAKPALHEDISETLILQSDIKTIIDRELGTDAAQLVADIIGGRHKDLVARNLLSSDLDCDRLDYLLRDSTAAGLVYGNIDLAYLIGNLKVAKEGRVSIVAMDRNHGLVAGEHFLTARYFHYAQFISHKTVGAAEVLLTAAMVELIRLRELPARSELLKDAPDPAATALALTDAKVIALMRQSVLEKKGSPHLIEASRRLLERRLLKAVARKEELVPIPDPKDLRQHRWDTNLGTPAAKRAFLESCGISDPSQVCYRTTTLLLTSVRGDRRPASMPGSARKAAKVVDAAGNVELLIEASTLMKQFSQYQWETRRVYFRDELDPDPSATAQSPDFEKLRGCF